MNWLDPSDVMHTLVVGPLAYAGTIVWLRVSGKRTLSQWNAFDAIVTFALGSTLATVILSADRSLVQGLVALGLLVALQFVATWLSKRYAPVRRLLKGHPTLLLFEGRFLEDALRRQRVTEGEVLAALRAKGIADCGSAYAVVLETSGSFSVIASGNDAGASALADVDGFPRPDAVRSPQRDA